ncbi:MAG TPA: ATP-binding protein [Rhodopila sp.]|jgi:signal transduction histidine kinase|nr:ATP-binding protein [Rhodopila sp.]
MRILAELGPGFLHDIRNLLAIMACCTEKARKRGSELTAESLLPLETAIFSAGELTRTFGHLLNNRSGASGLSAKTSTSGRLVALQPILKRVVSPAGLDYGLQALNVGEISACPAEFDSVILNLAINARDAFRVTCPSDPIVRVTTRCLSVRGQDGKCRRFVDVCIRDNGPGMDGQTLANAAKPYFTTKDEQGTGLGLYQAKRFCEASGGRLRIDSARGLGTAVHLLLPCVSADRQALSDMVPIGLPAGVRAQPIIISRTANE